MLRADDVELDIEVVAADTDDVELSIEVVAADTDDVELNIEVVAADTDDVELNIEVVAADQSENLLTLHVEFKRSRQRKPRPDHIFWRAWLSATQHAKSECQVFGQLGHFEFSEKVKPVS